ncbi:MAG TPA: hypothetical protein VHW65_02065 [Gemmatimonadales bacterium]|jgi:hypothetical protein|nr:hypothetical protein [Gemmatimonadales bacterium]
MSFRFIALALSGVIALAPPVRAQSAPKTVEILTNQTVVQMVLAKLPKDVIQAKIQSSKNNFDLTVQGLVGLQANNVPSDVVKSMMAASPKKAAGEVLTNESIIQMVTGKLAHDVILAKIQSTKTDFDVSSQGLVSLNTNKVPKDIIKVMMVGTT